MVKYLGEMEEEDLIMFVVEHLKDHKSPQKLIEGLEPVRVYLDLLYISTFSLFFYTRSSKKKLLNSPLTSGGK